MSQGPSAAGELHGKGDDFHKACKDAWEKRRDGDPTEYVVAETRVYGTNPISGYRVILRPS